MGEGSRGQIDYMGFMARAALASSDRHLPPWMKGKVIDDENVVRCGGAPTVEKLSFSKMSDSKGKKKKILCARSGQRLFHISVVIDSLLFLH